MANWLRGVCAAAMIFSAISVTGCGASVDEVGPATDVPEVDQEAIDKNIKESMERSGMKGKRKKK